MVLEIRNTSIIQVTAKLELERYELDKGLGQFNTDVKTLTIQRCCKSLRGPNTKVAYHVTGTVFVVTAKMEALGPNIKILGKHLQQLLRNIKI